MADTSTDQVFGQRVHVHYLLAALAAALTLCLGLPAFVQAVILLLKDWPLGTRLGVSAGFILLGLVLFAFAAFLFGPVIRLAVDGSARAWSLSLGPTGLAATDGSSHIEATWRDVALVASDRDLSDAEGKTDPHSPRALLLLPDLSTPVTSRMRRRIRRHVNRGGLAPVRIDGVLVIPFGIPDGPRGAPEWLVDRAKRLHKAAQSA